MTSIQGSEHSRRTSTCLARELLSIPAAATVFSDTPLLGALANNGGPTQTHALLPGSPAIDSGSNALAVDQNGIPLSTDQRGAGFDRIQNNGSGVSRVDIGAFEGVFLLGDVNQDGMVNFDDISPFISLLAGNEFLNQADVNRDGLVDFDDISSFISLLAAGGRSAPFSSSLTAPVIHEASSVMPEANAVEPTASSAVSVARSSEPASFASVLDATVFGATPIDTSVGPVAFGSNRYSFAGTRRSSLNGPERNGPLVTRRSLQGSAASFELSSESRRQYRSPKVSTEKSFTTAAELFDAHPESLDDVFDFEVEEVLEL